MKAISAAILAGGIILLIVGFQAADSFSSEVSRFFTGSPTDKAMWLLIGGALASVAGALGLAKGRG